MQRLRLFEAHGGRCHLCTRLIRAGEKWDVSHARPLALLGEDGGDNLKVAHRACHKVQTVEDQGRIAKSKRMKAKHVGAFRSASPMPGSRASKWKRKMNGRAELR